jgi:nitrite reductase (NADH) large subunit
VSSLRGVIFEDSLGIGAELDAEMAAQVGSYRCEWRATLEDESKLRRFQAFVNTEAADPSLVKIRLREQHRPATWEEKAS